MREGSNSSTPAAPCASSQMPVRSTCTRWARRRLSGVKGSGRRCGTKARITVTSVIRPSQASDSGSENCQANSAAMPQFSRYCTARIGPIGCTEMRSTSHWMAKPSSRAAPGASGFPPALAGRAAGAAESCRGFMDRTTIGKQGDTATMAIP